MKPPLLLFLLLVYPVLIQSKSASYPAAGAIVKQLSSVLKWTTTRAPPKTPQNDGDVHSLQFESGYFVETLVEGGKLGFVPYTIRVSSEGELFAVDSENNNVVKITPPLSQYSRARLVAGSFQGYSGHVDGKPSDARFYHPKGVTTDDKGNVYVADTSNLAIRKIGESGVTTIAGGKSSIAGYRDGPSEDAKFSTDFDLVYIGSTCSLLVVDRGNAALRQISLQQEDCDQQFNSISTLDIMMVFGAVLAGYIFCLLQHGFGSCLSQRVKQASENKKLDHHKIPEKPTLVVESLSEEPNAGWPSLSTLLSDLFKFSVEAIGNTLLNFIPQNPIKSKQGLTPLKDNLIMPEDQTEPQTIAKKKISPSPVTETLIQETPQLRQHKSNKQQKYKDSTVSSKHRSSKRQEYSEFYGPSEGAQLSSKGQKERSRHRHREKSGEVYSAVGADPKNAEMKSVEYSDAKFDQYTFRNKYGVDNTYRY
ncbi:uncharacterized protein A4U43_C01F14040 [Asparagus officinalis]|uniref:NHL repeat-containing protein n=1 Tax=Asparagus officinalis TaxID=4686 RepID=A0A5P1FP76_ASPOF|nr:uncharacterized protein LOC109822975 [Asparagus officinalis]ONK80115.1 uncharacterized protein A4U43_C01F14040 [Asparagus officinalis]